MTRDEMIEIIERGMPSLGTGEDPTMQRSVAHRGAIRVYDALLAAGVIPAEGTVAIERGRFERVLACAVASDDFSVWSEESAGAVIEAVEKLIPGDLDAIPAAPIGEGER